MHISEPVQENETNKILCDFEIETGYLISTRRADKILIMKKKKLSSDGFYIFSGPTWENERKRKER